MMNIKELIAKKRDGGCLDPDELKFFASAAADGSIPDYQVSAMLMAMYIKGLNTDETVALTLAMAHSGDIADLSGIKGVKGDKHSTGGVGDKTTLIVAPLVAECGVKIAKMSGRGLGHTGGTVDKLESIEGFNTSLSPEEFFEQAKNIGIAVIGQTGNLTPADKKLYALRDVTATVDSVPLIASSIMSKKLAAGSHTIVLDVKYGSGAFMKTPEDAKALAEEMVKIGKNCNRNVAALITDMQKPLGKNIGNSLEVIEAVDVLKGKGPKDLKEVAEALASEIVALSKNISLDEAKKQVEDAISSGKAYEKLLQWVKYQGGNAEWLENTEKFPKATYSFDIKSDCDGYVSFMDSESIGIVSVMLGAGREKKTDAIDMSAGITVEKKTGDFVKKGDILATLFTSKEELIENAAKKYRSALEFSKEPPEKTDEIYCIVR